MSGLLDIFDKVTVLEPLAKKLERLEVLDFVVDIKSKSVRIVLGADTLVEKPELVGFVEQIKSVYSLDDVDVKIKYRSLGFSEEYYRNLLVSLFRKSSICKAFLTASYGELEKDVLEIKNVKCGRDILEKNRCAEILAEIISFELGKNIRVVIDAEDIDMES